MRNIGVASVLLLSSSLLAGACYGYYSQNVRDLERENDKIYERPEKEPTYGPIIERKFGPEIRKRNWKIYPLD